MVLLFLNATITAKHTQCALHTLNYLNLICVCDVVLKNDSF